MQHAKDAPPLHSSTFVSQRNGRSRLLGRLLFALFIAGLSATFYAYASQQAAVDACYGEALRALASDNPDAGTGGFFVAPLQTTVTRQSYAIYRIESHVAINTGGWSDVLDSFPLKEYTADYACIAEQQEIAFWQTPWHIQIMHHSVFKPK
jgi:hypothetical protein